MKYDDSYGRIGGRKSLPVRGAWIEMGRAWAMPPIRMSLPVRGAWIEIIPFATASVRIWSLPVRGAWIEIVLACSVLADTAVAPRKGSVD